MKYAVSGLILLAASASALAQQDFGKVQIKTEKLNATTYMLAGSGGNIGVSVGPDAVLVIDDEFAPLSVKIKAAIAAISDKPVKYLVNTHFHGDHTGGNENFKRDGVTIVAQDNVRKRLLDKPDTAQGAPVLTFANELSFHLNGEDLQVIHLPHGHTDGDAIVVFKSGNIVHMGDMFFNGMYPYIDLGSGGHPDGVLAAADKALAMTDDHTRFIPGHGPMASRADLQAYRDMLATVIGRVKAMAGKSLAEVQAAKPTADFDEKWGKGFMRPPEFTETLWKAYQPK